MQEDEDQKAERWGKIFEAGMVQLYEAREALGMEADDSHRFYLRKISMIEVPANGTLPVPAADPGKQRGAKPGGDDHGGRRASQEAYKQQRRGADGEKVGREV